MKSSTIFKVTAGVVLLLLFRQTVAKSITFASAVDRVTAEQLDQLGALSR
jgi:hypothetical protein